jgi:hypothetical protein
MKKGKGKANVTMHNLEIHLSRFYTLCPKISDSTMVGSRINYFHPVYGCSSSVQPNTIINRISNKPTCQSKKSLSRTSPEVLIKRSGLGEWLE